MYCDLNHERVLCNFCNFYYHFGINITICTLLTPCLNFLAEVIVEHPNLLNKQMMQCIYCNTENRARNLFETRYFEITFELDT